MNARNQIGLLFGAAIFIAAAMSIHESVFNNYLSDTFHLEGQSRGFLEFPRETPGFLVVLFTGILSAVSMTRIGFLGAGTFVIGMIAMVVAGPSYYGMMCAMVIASIGMHLTQPAMASSAIALSKSHNRGRMMGLIGLLSNVGQILGTALIFLFLDKEHPQYKWAFLGAAAIFMVGGLFFAKMHVPSLHKKRPKFTLKHHFRLYYVLEFIFGARKQIFITFGPWVLVKVYGLPATGIAKLLLIGAVIGIVFKPLAGWAIDHFGERRIMIIDGCTLAFVCLGYGYAQIIAKDASLALTIASVCFIADNMLFSLHKANAVYLSRLSDSTEEISNNLSLGVSINHIASMIFPFIAGTIWDVWGYHTVFLAAAGLAVTLSIVATNVPPKETPIEEVQHG